MDIRVVTSDSTIYGSDLLLGTLGANLHTRHAWETTVLKFVYAMDHLELAWHKWVWTRSVLLVKVVLKRSRHILAQTCSICSDVISTCLLGLARYARPDLVRH